MPSPDPNTERDFASMKEDDWLRQAAEDEVAMAAVMNSTREPSGSGFNLNIGQGAPDDDKADDAIDFGDISDDDLPDEEEAPVPELTQDEGTSHDTSNDFEDDLFGGPISEDGDAGHNDSMDIDGNDDIHVAPPSPSRDRDFDGEDDDLTTAKSPRSDGDADSDAAPGAATADLMRLNFPDANQDSNIPDAPQDAYESARAAFPAWDKGVILNWNDVFRCKRASMALNTPARPPKPLMPTKLSLDLENGQQNLFRVPGLADAAPRQKHQEMEARGLVPLFTVGSDDEDSIDFEDDDEDELIAGHTLQDFEIICADWDSAIDPLQATPPLVPDDGPSGPDSDDDENWDAMMMDVEPVSKKRKVYDGTFPKIHEFETPNFDHFRSATARNAKRVILDMADPHLLIDDAEHISKRPKYSHRQRRMANGKHGQDKAVRFNFSNDEAYLALKENHLHKVRATLGNITLEHSIPALKLVWPYYRARVPLEKLFFDDLHRPTWKLSTSPPRGIQWADRVKKNRRTLKGLKVQDAYKKSGDLSLVDNSTAVLFEYSEQQPPTLSKFGMASRVVNYTRKQNEEQSIDSKKRDKNDIGETSALLPEDRSPFSCFGTVDPGETVPTLHNQMFRAPIFKHEAKKTDFILGRFTTGAQGTQYYIRPVEHIYTVGQTLPIIEVPGPHARKVTNVYKHRMKMLCYRMMRKSPSRTVSLPEITKHIKESNDQQNRQKLKEFLQYDKNEKQWGLRKGEMLMDEPNIRAMIQPEDVCLIDSMHIGLGNLDEEAFRRNASKKGEIEDDDEHGEDKKEESLSSKMAPWKTSKAFIDACQGKAMLALHGEGDPTGHGYGFSFIKTSMKGGYIEAVQGPNATTQDAIERERKANGGHSYNVKKQEQMYNNAIQEIWKKQKLTLTDATVHADDDVLPTADEDDRFNVNDANTATATPGASQAPMPHEGMSQISRTTGASRGFGADQVLRIERRRRNPDTGEMETTTTVIADPVVAKLYLKRRKEIDMENLDVYNAKPTGDAEYDREQAKLVEQELNRLYKNKERRHIREKQKGIRPMQQDGVTQSVEGGAKGTGTTRKCANCGQVGHIKTNKKLCPLLNGTMKAPNDEAAVAGFDAPTPSVLVRGGSVTTPGASFGTTQTVTPLAGASPVDGEVGSANSTFGSSFGMVPGMGGGMGGGGIGMGGGMRGGMGGSMGGSMGDLDFSVKVEDGDLDLEMELMDAVGEVDADGEEEDDGGLIIEM